MIKYGFYQIEFGILKIGYQDKKIVYIDLANEIDCVDEKNEVSDKAYDEILEYLNGKRKTFDLELEIEGTDFQKKVWKALLKIPYGQTRTYQEIACEVGNSKASRAVGMANHRNHIIIVIPCHRVIGKNNKLVGYGCGLEMKEKLLNIESKTK